MEIKNLNERYRFNSKKIKELENSLKNNYNKTIKEKILKLEKEQLYIMKSLRKSMYNNFSLEEINSINNPNEIVIEKEEASKLISDIEPEVKIEYKNNITETLDDVINTLKSDNKIEVLDNINGEENKVENLNHDDDETIVLKTNSDDDETIMLKSNVNLDNVKIVFDGHYKVVYNDGDNFFEEKINQTVLDYDLNENTTVYNLSIIKLLEDFDEKYNTNLKHRYMINDIDVIYDFRKIKKANSNIKKVKKLAKQEAKDRMNIKVKDNSFKDKIKKGAYAVATLAMVGLGLFGINKKINNNSNEKTPKEEISVSKEYGYRIMNEMTTESKKNIIEEIALKEEKEKTIKTAYFKEEKQEDTKENENETQLKIGNTVEFDNVNLYYASTDEMPTGDTSYLTNYRYKACLISVVYQNQVMNLVYNDSVSLDELYKICSEKYGEDFKISINFDLVDENNEIITKNVGWVNYNDAKDAKLVLK